MTDDNERHPPAPPAPGDRYADPAILERLRVVTFFVTTRCNARCQACFYWSSLNDARLAELTLEEIETVSRSMPPFPHLLLSGGEPILRADLVDIVALFARHNRLVSVDIPTNALLTDKIRDTAATLLDRHPNLTLTVGVSVDGPEATHDRLRGVPGNYRKVEATLEALGELRARTTAANKANGKPPPRLQVVTLTTVNAENLDEIERLAGDFSERFDLDAMMFESLRPMTKEAKLRAPAPAQHDRLVRLSMRINGRLWARRFADERGRRLAYLRGMYRAQRKVLGGGLLPMTCRGGDRLGVVEPDGRVRLCEFLDPVGNLREAGLDWARVWLGPEAARQRRWIVESRCSCTHCVNLGHSLDDERTTRWRRKIDEWFFRRT